MCRGPHKVVECPQKVVFNAMRQKLQEEAHEGDKGAEEESDEENQAHAKISSIWLLEPQE